MSYVTDRPYSFKAAVVIAVFPLLIISLAFLFCVDVVCLHVLFRIAFGHCPVSSYSLQHQHDTLR